MKKMRYCFDRLKHLLFATPFGAASAVFLCAALLASSSFKTEQGKIALTGIAFFTALWSEKTNAFPALAGAFSGSLAGGNFIQAAALAVLGVIAFFTRRRQKFAKSSKYLVSAAVQTVAFALEPDITLFKAGIYMGFVCAAALTAFLMGQAVRGLKNMRKGKPVTDARLISVSFLAGLIIFSFGKFSPLGVSPGAIFAAMFCMCVSYMKGAAAVACAAVAAAGRALSSGGDMLFIAVLCVCALVAGFAGKFSFRGAAAAFSLSAAAFTLVIRGAGALSFPEILLSGAFFMLLPEPVKRLMEENSAVKKTERLNERMEYITERLNYLSDVLKELARLFECGGGRADGFIYRQLMGVSESLKRLINSENALSKNNFTVNFGCAARPKRGNDETGDSCCVYEADGKLVAAISDGMGSGSAARRESMQAVSLIGDLLAVGFKPGEAAECVNDLLMLKDEGEIYATLDAAQFDLATGRLSLVKHGAPPSFVFRDGKIRALYAEALPVGIIKDARPACCAVDMRKGDAFVMMSDGVSDALGSELIASLTEKLETAPDSETAARLLLSLAEEKGGGKDDMTVVVAKIA